MKLTLRSYLLGLLAQLCLAGLSHVEKLEEEHADWLEQQVREICKVDILDDLAWNVAKGLIPRIFELAREQIANLSEKATELEKAQAVAAIVQQISAENA